MCRYVTDSRNLQLLWIVFSVYPKQVILLQVDKIDIITAAMGHALATEGGFCTGSTRVIEHQVLKCDRLPPDYSHFQWRI